MKKAARLKRLVAVIVEQQAMIRTHGVDAVREQSVFVLNEFDMRTLELFAEFLNSFYVETRNV